MTYIITSIFFFAVIMVYFKIAEKFRIVDHPNERSSHLSITVRGGGIIFIFAALVALQWHFREFYLPLTGIVIIAIISFLDDIYTLPSRIRLIFHLIAVTLMLAYLNAFTIFTFWEILTLFFVIIGIINAYNFMDGINGITGAYSAVMFISLQYVNLYLVPFINADMIWLPLTACLVFLFFNFRKRAKCFAGDVGSITIAFWISLLLFRLIFVTHNYIYILFLTVYGVDSVLTIIHRLILKQNIFKPHRLHFYQLLANEHKISHLYISAGYALVQLIVNVFLILNYNLPPIALVLISISPLLIIYLIVKNKLMKTYF